jgi:hypothetical protein
VWWETEEAEAAEEKTGSKFMEAISIYKSKGRKQ